MNLSKNQKIVTIGITICCIATISSLVYSHCQIPCGIYDDDVRFKMMAEDIHTIEKSMRKIKELSKQPGKNANQIVRWVDNKEVHADKIAENITYYFMAQRVKPAKAINKPKHEKYVQEITLLHKMLIAAMKCKQSTDIGHAKKLSQLLKKFEKVYSAK